MAQLLLPMGPPKHSLYFCFRRFLNWFPMGLAYAFLYMGRYNLTVCQKALGDTLMPKEAFGWIFGVGAWVYACSFIINGPLTDKVGGRRTMLVATFGALCANALMGLTLYGITYWNWTPPLLQTFVILYALNMYFQSFGAVAIVTVKAPWFHVRERGTFSTIFGVLISLGIFFAFDWGFAIVDATRATLKEDLGLWATLFRMLAGSGGSGVDQNWWIFFAPACLLGLMWIIMLFGLRNTPGEAGLVNFFTGEGSLNPSGERESIKTVFARIITHPVLLVVCLIEFCSGVLRNGIMQWYPLFASDVGFKKTFFITDHWGLMLLICGTIGAILTGWCSDKFFGSRRAPMAVLGYGLMLIAIMTMALKLQANLWFAGIAVLLISTAVIGVHGIFSGTATADFAGTKNTGAAVAIVDGMVYLGTGMQAVVIGYLAPQGELAKDSANWSAWPFFLIPFAMIGLLLATRIWHAKPKPYLKEPPTVKEETWKEELLANA